eukprot:323339-Pyramimonas_sp.AAC.2
MDDAGAPMHAPRSDVRPSSVDMSLDDMRKLKPEDLWQYGKAACKFARKCRKEIDFLQDSPQRYRDLKYNLDVMQVVSEMGGPPQSELPGFSGQLLHSLVSAVEVVVKAIILDNP